MQHGSILGNSGDSQSSLCSTSYYGNLKNLHADGFVPISVSRGVPKFYQGAQFIELAPSWALIKAPIADYVPEYKHVLSKLDPTDVLKSLLRISGGAKIALLCYEKPGEFCHRRLIAEWLEPAIQMSVAEVEVQPSASKQPKKPSQPLLF